MPRTAPLGLPAGVAALALAAALGPAGAARAQDAPDRLAAARARGHLVWGADLEGGAPFIFADPRDPTRTAGFEVDIAKALGEELGLEVRFEQRAWASLYQDLEKGAIDLAMNGLEVTDETRKLALFSRPYYLFSEQLVVRQGDDRIHGLADLRGRPAGTLGGTLAERMLQRAGAVVRAYDGQVEPLDDLELGRTDAVLLDLPIIKYYAHPRQRPGLRWAGAPVGLGAYAVAVAPGQEPLRAALDAALARLVLDGRLARILRGWDLWDERQWALVRPDEAGPVQGLFEDARAASAALAAEVEAAAAGEARQKAAAEAERHWLLRHGPVLLQGAWTTVWLSTLAMTLAVGLGVPLALGRLYGAPAVSVACAGFVEVFRGTPVMLQLYVIYYGLPHLGLDLSAAAAALLGLGLNYAAYEAEIYRAGFQALPKGQLEAALALGMTRAQAIRRVLLPQAFRMVLPPVTNDFVALLKDSSIVSVIAMQELTKRFYILGRSDVTHFVHLAAATAALYLLMSYPLSTWSRRMEKRLGGGGHA